MEFTLKVTEKQDKKKAKVAPKSALKAKRNDKIEEKAEAKREKGVKFNEEVETHLIGERKWNDFKTKSATFKKGTFTAEEVKTLMNALCAFVK